MTVIAGVSLFNGVMLMADTRVTVSRAGRPKVHCDIAQKIFPLTPTMALGFSGNVEAASALLKVLAVHLRRRGHQDSLSLLQWLPRFFRHEFAKLDRKTRGDGVAFMAGGVVTGRINVVERQKVAALLQSIARQEGEIVRNSIPGIVVNVLRTSAELAYVPLPGTVAGVLYVMRSPAFVPSHVPPLDFVAVGSGSGASHLIQRHADWILAGEPGNDFMESTALRLAVSQFIAESNLESVGGMYPCVKIDSRGGRCLGVRERYPLYDVSLQFHGPTERWVQTNHTTGKQIPLLRPWEIMSNMPASSRMFNDRQEAFLHFNPARRPT